MKINLRSSLLTVGAFVPTAFPVLADIKYTTEMSVAGQNNGKPFSTITTYRRKGAECTESSYSIGNMEQRSVTITSCALKQTLTLDPTLKIYYATPLVPGSSEEGCGVGTPVAKGSKTGTITTTLVSFKSLGVQKVGNVNTNAYEVVTRMQMAGCMGNTDMTTKQQLFVAPNISLGDGDSGCTTMRSDCTSASGSNCNAKFIRKGNWAAYNKVMRNLSLRTRTFTKPTDAKWQSEMQIKNISRAPLSPSLFAVPAGFRKLSQSEFLQAQSKAMMEKMTNANFDDND
jgi:hypothetical protein